MYTELEGSPQLSALSGEPNSCASNQAMKVAIHETHLELSRRKYKIHVQYQDNAKKLHVYLIK